MSSNIPRTPLNIDEAIQLIVEALRKAPDLDKGANSRSGQQGCDIWIPIIHDGWTGRTGSYPFPEATEKTLEPFYDGAWELSRRGIIRPGQASPGANLSIGASGQGAPNGWSLTGLGREWIKIYNQENFFPVDPGSFSNLINKYLDKFGAAFIQRANETAGCYRSANYLATCAMAGAACEAIVLSVARERCKDDEKVDKIYFGTRGRSELIKKIVSVNLPAAHKKALETAVDLLAFWRDSASHGAAVEIGEFEAHDAISRLLRFSKFVDREWKTFCSELPQNSI